MVSKLFKGLLAIIVLIVMAMVSVVQAGVRAALHIVPRAPSEVFVGIEDVGSLGDTGLTMTLDLSVDNSNFTLHGDGALQIVSTTELNFGIPDGANIIRSGPLLAPC